MTEGKRFELEQNYKALALILPELLSNHEGQYALMRHGKIIEYFPTPMNALLSGREQFPDDLFSVQEIRKSAADFGWHSRVPSHSEF